MIYVYIGRFTLDLTWAGLTHGVGLGDVLGGGGGHGGGGHLFVAVWDG